MLSKKMKFDFLMLAVLLALLCLPAPVLAAGSLLDKSFWLKADAADVAAVLDAGAEVNARNWDGRTPLHYAAEYSKTCLLYTSPSPRDATLSRMPSSA